MSDGIKFIEVGETWYPKYDANNKHTITSIIGTQVYSYSHRTLLANDAKKINFSTVIDGTNQCLYLDSWVKVDYQKFEAYVYENAQRKKVYREVQKALIDLRQKECDDTLSLKLLAMKVEDIKSEISDSDFNPIPYFKIQFDERDFVQIVDYLSRNRRGQSVLIRPVSTNLKFKSDFDERAIWMGKKVNLRFENLSK